MNHCKYLETKCSKNATTTKQKIRIKRLDASFLYSTTVFGSRANYLAQYLFVGYIKQVYVLSKSLKAISYSS